MEENIDVLTVQTVEELPEGSTVYGNVNDEFVQIPSRVFQQSQGGDGNNPGGTPPNNYVFVAGNDSDNEEPTGEIGKINADFLQGRKAEEFLLKDVVSDKFDTTKTYSIGDYCIYTDRLFRFTEAKDAGAWDGEKVIPVTVSGELTSLTSELKNKVGLNNPGNKINIGWTGTEAPLMINGEWKGDLIRKISYMTDCNSEYRTGTYIVNVSTLNSPRIYGILRQAVTNDWTSQDIIEINGNQRRFHRGRVDNTWYNWIEG